MSICEVYSSLLRYLMTLGIMIIFRGTKDGRPHRRTSRESGQGLTAAAISGVVRALGHRPSFLSLVLP